MAFKTLSTTGHHVWTKQLRRHVAKPILDKISCCRILFWNERQFRSLGRKGLPLQASLANSMASRTYKHNPVWHAHAMYSFCIYVCIYIYNIHIHKGIKRICKRLAFHISELSPAFCRVMRRRAARQPRLWGSQDATDRVNLVDEVTTFEPWETWPKHQRITWAIQVGSQWIKQYTALQCVHTGFFKKNSHLMLATLQHFRNPRAPNFKVVLRICAGKASKKTAICVSAACNTQTTLRKGGQGEDW